MNRSVLSAKASTAEQCCRREAERLGSARRAEAARREDVRRAEASVWGEIARAAEHSVRARVSDRPAAALHALAEAKRQHGAASEIVRERLASAQRAEQVRDQALKMLSILRRRDSAAVETRRSDELVELALGAAALRSKRQESRADAASCSPTHADQDGSANGTLCAFGWCPPRAAGQLSPAPEPGALAAHAARAAGPNPSFARDESGSGTLRVQCSARSGSAPIALTLTQSAAAGISVVLRTPSPETVLSLARERASVIRSLRDAGINVLRVGVEAGPAEKAGTADGSAVARRRTRGERDDDAFVA